MALREKHLACLVRKEFLPERPRAVWRRTERKRTLDTKTSVCLILILRYGRPDYTVPAALLRFFRPRHAAESLFLVKRRQPQFGVLCVCFAEPASAFWTSSYVALHFQFCRALPARLRRLRSRTFRPRRQL